MTEHGSDANRFVPGTWPGCLCGYRPKDNRKLTQHFAEHGFREVDDHGRIVRIPVDLNRVRVQEHLAGRSVEHMTAWAEEFEEYGPC